MVVAADDARILRACEQHGVDVVLTHSEHASGSDRLAQACELLGLDGDDIVVNVQGDEPLIDIELIARCAALLAERDDCVMSTAAHVGGETRIWVVGLDFALPTAFVQAVLERLSTHAP